MSARMSAEPTITPSAKPHASVAAAGVPMPTPTSSGRSVRGRRAATSSAAVPARVSRAPVTP